MEAGPPAGRHGERASADVEPAEVVTHPAGASGSSVVGPSQSFEPAAGAAAGGRLVSWFRDPAVVIALLALILSVVATVLTQLESSRARDRESRQQLTSYLQQLRELEQQPDATSTDYLLLADQAASIMQTIPATAVEYILVAEAFVAASEYGRAEAAFDSAEDRAGTIVELVTIQRGLGFATMQSGDLETGRDRFTLALAEVSSPRFGQTPTAVRAQLGLDTELLWADAEMRAGQCGEARRHLQRARDLAAEATTSYAVTDLRTYESRLSQCEASADPSTPTRLPTPG